MFGSVGLMTMRPMACVARRPMNCQVRPPFVLLNTPAPGESELRESSSPVPIHTMFVSLGAIATSLIVCMFVRSERFSHVTPLFVVFHRPLVANAAYTSFGFCGLPARPLTRPDMFAGPIERQRNCARNAESGWVDCARSAVGRNARASAEIVRRMGQI